MKIILIFLLAFQVMLLPWFIRIGWQMVRYLRALREARLAAIQAGSLFHTSGRWRSDVKHCLSGLSFAVLAVLVDLFWLVITVIFIQVV